MVCTSDVYIIFISCCIGELNGGLYDSPSVPCAIKVAKTKKEASSCSTTAISSSISNKVLGLQSVVKANAVVLPRPGYVSRREEDDAKKVIAAALVTAHVSKMDISDLLVNQMGHLFLCLWMRQCILVILSRALSFCGV
ncbi:hypothetical protein PIB30_035626 [Stylosanthes scabra]|uniref:Uncharacterized protein n=1 Tax=Stylosanthes scabra TaxID=79078 RepID=A0ABU6ZC76_9FABA|nr:hypothetical protein [Stylosanthes scabra]